MLAADAVLVELAVEVLTTFAWKMSEICAAQTSPGQSSRFIFSLYGAKLDVEMSDSLSAGMGIVFVAEASAGATASVGMTASVVSVGGTVTVSVATVFVSKTVVATSSDAAGVVTLPGASCGAPAAAALTSVCASCATPVSASRLIVALGTDVIVCVIVPSTLVVAPTVPVNVVFRTTCSVMVFVVLTVLTKEMLVVLVRLPYVIATEPSKEAMV